VEDVKICLDDNDVISLQPWLLWLQQGGDQCVLKDRGDPPPPESGLSEDSFVMCVQTKFQRDCFLALGRNFVSIDATHDTTQYAGLQLFTLLARDLWGHGTLCGIFPFTVLIHFPLNRCSCCLDVDIEQHRSNNNIFFKFCKKSGAQRSHWQ
jgi:hypothetical protein